MITQMRRRSPACPAQRAAAALAAYQSHTAHRPALGALYGYRQITGRKGELVDGPACLVVVTAETITLSEARTGVILDERPLAQLAAYLVDAHGRFVVRFDSWQGSSHVGSFRPVAAPDSALSTCEAAGLFVRQATAAWEARIGRPFTNTWTSPAVPIDH